MATETARRGDLDYHCARLLVLLGAFNLRGSQVIGLTKLAKLDFLLRYPAFLDRLMQSRGWTWPADAAPREVDKDAVEARMIRYKYGPWDDRYYLMLGVLAGMGLVTIGERGGVMAFNVTDLGETVNLRLVDRAEWRLVAARCDLLASKFDWSGNELKETIYRELPEVVDRPLRSAI